MQFKLPKKPKIEQHDKGPDKRSFIVVPFRAATDDRLTRQQLRVLLCLASYCNRAGVAWVGQQTIADMLGFSKVMACKHMQMLEKYGYIRIVAKGYPGARAHTRQLIFNPDISAEDACAVANDPAPFIIRKAERFMQESEEIMARKRKINDKQETNLSPDDKYDDNVVNEFAQLRAQAGEELFAALVQRCGQDATLEHMQAELRRMLA
jgi:biotin operon repressor